MVTIKKKDFKKSISKGRVIKEFVGDGGGIISGDEKFNKNVDVKTGPINTDPDDIKGVALDTDTHKSQAVQPRNWWWSMSYGYGQGKGTLPIGANIGMNGSGEAFDESIDESELTAEQRMKKMVEDILTNKTNKSELVKKRSNLDINRNKIPDIDELEDTKMIVVGKLDDIVDSVKSGNLNGEELGIMLNHLLININTDSIPRDYKRIIKNHI